MFVPMYDTSEFIEFSDTVATTKNSDVVAKQRKERSKYG